MGSWVYGLVEIERKEKDGIFKELTLSEVYFHEGKKVPYMFQPVEWKELKTKDEKDMVVFDITQQLKKNFKFIASIAGGSYKIWLKKK